MRDEIVKYLGSVMQSTAKTIAQRLSYPQLEVAKELNAMNADGVVEREKKPGAGNEYHYWLTRSDVAPTPSSHIDGQTAEVPSVVPPAEGNPAQAALERQVATLQNQIVDANTRQQADADARVAIETERDELKVENESLQDVIAKLRENNAALERRIDELTIVDAEFKPNEVYVTVGRYAKPKRHKTIEKAQRRASSLVRTEKESEVLVCEPIGRVVRGSEWRPR